MAALNWAMLTPQGQPVPLPHEKWLFSSSPGTVAISLFPHPPGSPLNVEPKPADTHYRHQHGTLYLSQKRVVYVAPPSPSSTSSRRHLPSGGTATSHTHQGSHASSSTATLPPAATTSTIPTPPSTAAASKGPASLESLSVPLRAFVDGRLVQPWFSANYYEAVCLEGDGSGGLEVRSSLSSLAPPSISPHLAPPPRASSLTHAPTPHRARTSSASRSRRAARPTFTRPSRRSRRAQSCRRRGGAPRSSNCVRRLLSLSRCSAPDLDDAVADAVLVALLLQPRTNLPHPLPSPTRLTRRAPPPPSPNPPPPLAQPHPAPPPQTPTSPPRASRPPPTSRSSSRATNAAPRRAGRRRAWSRRQQESGRTRRRRGTTRRRAGREALGRERTRGRRWARSAGGRSLWIALVSVPCTRAPCCPSRLGRRREGRPQGVELAQAVGHEAERALVDVGDRCTDDGLMSQLCTLGGDSESDSE